MNTNNLDTSSNGVTLELTCFRDTLLSQDNFNENFTNVYHSGGSLLNDRYFNVDSWLFVDYGNFDSDFDLADLDNYSFTKADLISWLTDEYDNETLNDISAQFDKYFSQLTKDELQVLCQEDTNEYDRVDNCTKYLTPKFEVLAIRGYCQGDYAEIIFRHCDIEKYNFEDKDQFLDIMQDYFTNLFYDAPCYVNLEVDDLDIEPLNYGLSNEYEYNKEELIKHAGSVIEHEKKTYILNWLEDNLPDTCDYN